MNSAYIIANVNVTDAVQYEHYRQLSSAAIKHAQAQVLVRGGNDNVSC